MDITKITVYKKQHFQKGIKNKTSVYYHFWFESSPNIFRLFIDVDVNQKGTPKVEQRWIPVAEGHYPSSIRQARWKAIKKSEPITEADYHSLVGMIFGDVV